VRNEHSQDSVETLLRRGGKRLLHFTANLFRKRCARFRQHCPSFIGDITKNILVFFSGHSVDGSCRTTNIQKLFRMWRQKIAPLISEYFRICDLINYKIVKCIVCVSDLDGKLKLVDHMLGADTVRAAEVKNELGDAVVVRQRTAADVDVVGGRLVQWQSDVMSRVQQRSAHLQQTATRSHGVTSWLFWVLKHPQTKCKKNHHVEFNERLHNDIQYIQKQPHLLQFFDFV